MPGIISARTPNWLVRLGRTLGKNIFLYLLSSGAIEIFFFFLINHMHVLLFIIAHILLFLFFFWKCHTLDAFEWIHFQSLQKGSCLTTSGSDCWTGQESLSRKEMDSWLVLMLLKISSCAFRLGIEIHRMQNHREKSTAEVFKLLPDTLRSK